MRIGATTLGFLHHRATLDESLEAIAAAGYRAVDILELARDLGADTVVFAPGRTFALNPAPIDDVLAALAAQLCRLVEAAERYGVVLAVETVPFGFMQTGSEVAETVDNIASPWLRGAYDVANTIAHKDAGDGLAALGPERLRAVHISGSWRDRWAHARVIGSHVDLAAYADGLRAVGYTAPPSTTSSTARIPRGGCERASPASSKTAGRYRHAED